MEKHKKFSHKKFELCIDKIASRLQKFIKENNIKIDYVSPMLRSGGVPAMYIANRLNIVKCAPIQVKHVAYSDGTTGYADLFMPFDSLNNTKKEPVFLLVDGTCASGESARRCIDEFKSRYKDAKILYVCIAKQYGCQSFGDSVIYEDMVFHYNGRNEFTKEKCKELGIEYYLPLYPWEILEQERNHPDDLEENIYY
ncbi:MAG: phosphoribosyltransferase [Oscillospiraceae bacterium]|nr:phosphoribosyltransferase [Oscillospiraceae bacterium]